MSWQRAALKVFGHIFKRVRIRRAFTVVIDHDCIWIISLCYLKICNLNLKFTRFFYSSLFNIWKEDMSKFIHNILNSKYTSTREHKNSSLKTWDHPHKISTTIYTTQPSTCKHQGTPVTPYILVIRKLNSVYFNLDKTTLYELCATFIQFLNSVVFYFNNFWVWQYFWSQNEIITLYIVKHTYMDPCWLAWQRRKFSDSSFYNFKWIKGPPDDDPIGVETCSGNKTTLTYICIVNHFYFIVVLMARTRTYCSTTQQNAKHKGLAHTSQ
jgi:hypothetical protein